MGYPPKKRLMLKEGRCFMGGAVVLIALGISVVSILLAKPKK